MAKPITHPQRHVVKDCCNRLRAAGLEQEAQYLDSVLDVEGEVANAEARMAEVTEKRSRKKPAA